MYGSTVPILRQGDIQIVWLTIKTTFLPSNSQVQRMCG